MSVMPVMPSTPAVSKNTSSITFGSKKEYRARATSGEGKQLLEETKQVGRNPIRQFMKKVGVLGAFVAAAFGCSPGNDIIPGPGPIEPAKYSPVEQQVRTIAGTLGIVDTTKTAVVKQLDYHDGGTGYNHSLAFSHDTIIDKITAEGTDFLETQREIVASGSTKGSLVAKEHAVLDKNGKWVDDLVSTYGGSIGHKLQGNKLINTQGSYVLSTLSPKSAVQLDGVSQAMKYTVDISKMVLQAVKK